LTLPTSDLTVTAMFVKVNSTSTDIVTNISTSTIPTNSTSTENSETDDDQIEIEEDDHFTNTVSTENFPLDLSNLTDTINRIGYSVSENKTLTALTAVSGGAVVYITSGITGLPMIDIFTSIYSWILGISGLLGFRKKGKPYGYVYNSQTYEPIPQAIVRIYDFEGNIRRTEVTDIYGVFCTYLETGKYNIKVTKNQFLFPSKITNKLIGKFDNIYTGELLEIQKDTDISISIPIDPKKEGLSYFIRTAIQKNLLIFWSLVRYLLFAGGFVFSLCAYNYSQNLINTIILVFYVFAFSILLLTRNRKIKYGRTMDQNGKVKSGIEIHLREENYQTIKGKRVTDKDGFYRFIVKPDNYTISLADPNYELATRELFIKKSIDNDAPMVIAQDLSIDKK